MGTWEETCALTLLPIYRRQPCVMVVMNERFSKRYWKADHRYSRPTYSLIEMDNACDVEAIHGGLYDDGGWIKGVDNPEAKPTPDDIERPLSQRRVTIFFHAAVWDEAVVAGMKEAQEWAKHRKDEIDSLDRFHRETLEREGKPYEPSIFAKKPPSEDAIKLYAAAKVALESLTRSWAVQLAPKGIRVAAVAPGPIATPISEHRGLDPDQAKALPDTLIALALVAFLGPGMSRTEQLEQQVHGRSR